MILDTRTQFASGTAINTGGAGSYLVGDVVDLSITRDIGPGEDLYFVVQAKTALLSATGTIAFALVSDTTSAVTIAGTVHVQTPAFAQAAAVAGTVFVAVALPQGTLYKRFLGLVQTTAVAAFTGGTVNAFLTHDYAKFRAYATALIA